MKQIFKKALYLISVTTLFFTSCIFLKSNKSQTIVSETYIDSVKINGIIQVHIPYCGGAKPTPEMEKGSNSPLKNKVFFVVVKDDTSKKIIKTLQTNENGEFEIYLSANIYWVFDENKMLPYDEFVKNNSGDGTYLISKGQDCLLEWYNSPDFIINAISDTTITYTYYQACFTGVNPCLNYIGTVPP